MRAPGLCAAILVAASSLPALADMPSSTLYTLHCSGCHGDDGRGTPEKGIPDLADAGRYVAIALGRRYLIEVPGVSQSALDDERAAQLLNYVLRRFAADALPADFTPYTATEVARYRRDKASDAAARRRAVLDELRERGHNNSNSARQTR